MNPPENCGTKQREEGQITQELNNAENAAARLTARIDTLEGQLNSVLQETISPTPKEETKLEKALVPLAARINTHFKLLHHLGNRLEDIETRLEIR